MTATLALVVSCSRDEDAMAKQLRVTYEKQLQVCHEQILKDPLVPIIGGGYIDMRRFGFIRPMVRFEDGQCGINGFATGFYWTGEAIVPTEPSTRVPKHWRRFEVAALLWNQRKGRECKISPDPSKCGPADQNNPKLPLIWPEILVVRPMAYPDLEIWMPAGGYKKGVDGINFAMRGWLRPDGSPRQVNCWHLPGYDPPAMTKTDLESLDFGTKTLPCQVELWDFIFEGGAARIRSGTEALHDITPALKALHQYISDTVIREKLK